MKLRAGELRERITFVRPSSTVDNTVGGETGAPVDVKTVYGKLAPGSNFQRIEADAANAVNQKVFWIRWTTGIEPAMWVRHNNVLHTIVAIDVVEHNEVLAVKCEVRNDGTA